MSPNANPVSHSNEQSSAQGKLTLPLDFAQRMLDMEQSQSIDVKELIDFSTDTDVESDTIDDSLNSLKQLEQNGLQWPFDLISIDVLRESHEHDETVSKSQNFVSSKESNQTEEHRVSNFKLSTFKTKKLCIEKADKFTEDLDRLMEGYKTDPINDNFKKRKTVTRSQALVVIDKKWLEMDTKEHLWKCTNCLEYFTDINKYVLHLHNSGHIGFHAKIPLVYGETPKPLYRAQSSSTKP